MTTQKNLPPNVDWPSARLYHYMGLEIDLYTPIFAMARVAGWAAHIIEQLDHNCLTRPRARYTGPPNRQVKPINQRGEGLLSREEGSRKGASGFGFKNAPAPPPGPHTAVPGEPEVSPRPFEQVFEVGLGAGAGVGAWQWSSMARRAYSAIRSRSRPSICASRRGKGSRARTSSVRVIRWPGPSPPRPRPSRAARSGHPRFGGLAVEPQGVRQEDRVERAVMHPALRPQRVRERVDHAQPLVEADPAQQGPHHHRAPGLAGPRRRARPSPGRGRRTAAPRRRSRRRSGGTVVER